MSNTSDVARDIDRAAPHERSAASRPRRVAATTTVALPKYVEVETSRKCNRTCGWCPNGEHPARRTQELMDWSLFQRIVAELGDLDYTGWLAFHNYNEPLLNKRLIEEVGVVKADAPQARPAIFSNGDPMTTDLFRQLVEAGVEHIRITLYPHHADTPASFETIKTWLDRVRILDVFNWDFRGVRQGLAATTESAPLRVEVISPDIYGTYNNRGGSVTLIPLLAAPRTAPCLMTSTSASIDYLGRMKMCCCVYPEAPEHSDYVVGDLNTSTFADLWAGQAMSAYRRAHSVADWSLSPACRTCRQPLPETRL